VTPTAEMGICRLMCTQPWRPKSTNFGYTKKSQDMEQETVLQVGSDRMKVRYVCCEPFTVKFAHKCEWQRELNPDSKRGLVCYTDGSKTKALVLRCIDGA